MNFTEDQKHFIELAMNGYNVFLTGKAGTGKSTILREFLELKEGSVACLATTGVAANNVKGSTIHSFFQINPNIALVNQHNVSKWGWKKKRLWGQVETVVIDEISMATPLLIDNIEKTLQYNGMRSLISKQLIFIGDLAQLPPVLNNMMTNFVIDYYGGIEFYLADVLVESAMQKVELTQIVRQSDQEFIDALNNIREGRQEPYFKQFITDTPNDGVYLAPYKETVARLNQEKYDAVDGKEYVYVAKKNGYLNTNDCNFEEVLKLKDGVKIMHLVNKGDLFNGAVGTFRIINELPYIEFEGKKYALEKTTYAKYSMELDSRGKITSKETASITQYPVRLAYALTIHKSQGLTFDEMTLDLTRDCFANGQLYVALSRVRSPQGLKIIM